ncbi:MAG: hypothetical protein CHACPFDD_00872 [Phycisphaerae bacterium]|nr:hypothetical protein [Phycisphaerae bacterium]
MVVKVFDVAHGSASFLISPTGKFELVDLGARADWSPLDHIYRNYIPCGGRLDRIVLTHHHGDHLDDVYKLTTDRMPRVVLRRSLVGRYEQACRESNSTEGQQKARHFDQLFAGYTGSVSDVDMGSLAWGIGNHNWSLSVEQADAVTSSWGGMANCCSFVDLYDHSGTKMLLCGDMETDGMVLLLNTYSDFRSMVRGVNILLAPHHGHSSGFSTDLMNAIGKPDIVIASIMSGDEHVDSRYSSSDWVKGVRWSDGSVRRLLTTRNYGAITVTSRGNGGFQVTTNQR